jgi:putative oxidoreductase
MIFGHGLGKLEKLISGSEIKFLDLFGIGPVISFYLSTFAEFIAATFVLLGLFTRINSVFLIINMGVAAFIAHADDPFSRQEKAVLFLISYIFIFLVGPGKYSLQNWAKLKFQDSGKIIKFIFQ